MGEKTVCKLGTGKPQENKLFWKTVTKIRE
jgi:hypothetical protein